jgi:serine/threonine kinase 3
MAPEVLQSTEYDTKADIWSLAITAIELAEGEPPHSNIHPMRAIFMIPNSDPPVLKDQKAWSANFHDFLRVCLVKDPAKRPSATDLIQSHPFITKAKNKQIIAQLVDECMGEIDEYRAQEAAEAANKVQNQGTNAFGTSVGTINNSSGTMVGNTGTMINSGTMMNKGDAGTMVFNSGTIVNTDVDDEDYDGGDTGTMVVQKSNKPQPNNNNNNNKPAAAADSSEPSYMAHLRDITDSSGKNKPGAVAAATGTMVQKPSKPIQAFAEEKQSNNNILSSDVQSPGDIKELYKTSRKIDHLVSSNNSVVDLEKAEKAIAKAYEEERSAMEKFYDEQRKTIKQAIKKQKEADAAAKKQQKKK